MKFVNRLKERETLGGSFLVRRKSLLPRSISGENPLTVIGTLHRPRASSEFFRKEEGWNHEHTRRPFTRDGAFLCSKMVMLKTNST